MSETQHQGGGAITAADAPSAELERLRRRLGFADEPEPPIDGRYRIDRTLGRGAMGEVHLAYDPRLARTVALKLVRVSAAIPASVLQARLEREALALARVDHPNVIHIFDVGTHRGQPYITMQYVAGTPLRGWQLGRSPRDILAAYLQAARGLAAAHAGDLVHRDFKPDNAIVGDDGLVRVLDFGIAAALRSDDPAADALPSATPSLVDAHDTDHATADTSARPGLEPMTSPGTLLGTLPYMASEQLAGRRADARSDQYAFCVALWEALAGQRPFTARSPDALRRSIAAGPDPRELAPRWLRPILLRGLADDPRRRWPTMDDLIRAIERARDRRRKFVLGGGLALALTAAVVGGRALSPGTGPLAEPCDAFVAALDPLWPAARRDQLASLDIDPAMTRHAIASLDELADTWRSAARARCDGDEAPPPADPRRVCLDAWRLAFADTLDLLAGRGDARTFARAPDLLARLVPPGGDHCALRPARAVDPDVWRTAELARATVLLGDIDAAFVAADAAVARAEGLARDPFTADVAAAHAARAEVAAFAGRRDQALAELTLAERHALGARADELLLPAWILGAKLHALAGDPAEAELARATITRAEPLTFALGLADLDLRRAELLEAHGLAERGRDPRAAIDLHRRAESLFVAAGQPTLAVKSLINIGACQQDLEDLAAARRTYADAVAVLGRAGVPPGYRNRVQLERNLGLLAYAGDDPAELRAGLVHLEFMHTHGTAAERLEALELLVALALELGEPDVTLRWSDRALAELAAQPQADARAVVGIQRAAGIALASAGDPRGEPLLQAAERAAAALPAQVRFNLQRSWVQWLEQAGRCSEADARRAATIAAIAAEASDDHPDEFATWRDDGPQPPCAP